MVASNPEYKQEVQDILGISKNNPIGYSESRSASCKINGHICTDIKPTTQNQLAEFRNAILMKSGMKLLHVVIIVPSSVRPLKIKGEGRAHIPT